VPQPDSTRDWGGPPLGAIREAASELIAIAEERFPDKFSEIVSKGHVETSERQNRRTAGLGLEDRDDVLPGRELRLWGGCPAARISATSRSRPTVTVPPPAAATR